MASGQLTALILGACKMPLNECDSYRLNEVI
jgi:hypothetical protein